MNSEGKEEKVKNKKIYIRLLIWTKRNKKDKPGANNTDSCTSFPGLSLQRTADWGAQTIDTDFLISLGDRSPRLRCP